MTSNYFPCNQENIVETSTEGSQDYAELPYVRRNRPLNPNRNRLANGVTGLAGRHGRVGGFELAQEGEGLPPKHTTRRGNPKSTRNHTQHGDRIL